ncbi:hypothetical protein GCM10020358_55580 [Amorphoplanes nipponensis]|uniref:hypothetical protein n=1 Tax=Actinoplanes nipponensis TaxID=135950 RepID=UPI0031ECFE41
MRAVDVRRNGTLRWSADACDFFGVPMAMLPEVRPSSGCYGTATAAFSPGVRIARAGDQQPPCSGRLLHPGRNSEMHVRHRQLPAAQHGQRSWSLDHGLLSTVAYQIAGNRPYAWKGLDRDPGSLVQWFRDRGWS